MAYFRDFGYNMFSRTNDKTKAGLSKCFTDFEKDYFFLTPRSDTYKALSEHEIMSAILIIVNLYSYGTFTETLDLYLAIRSISECVYAVKPSDTEKVEQEFGLKNCLIRLLNSSTVDVDKLDYIARDTQMSGYDNVVSDNEKVVYMMLYYKQTKNLTPITIRNINHIMINS